MMNPLIRLGELGQSPWYDHITRDMIGGGELVRLITNDGLRGMTSNPTIFEKAVSGSRLYDEDLRRLAAEGRTAAEIFDEFSAEDVRDACDIFRPVYEASGEGDGTVSIEVSPALANDEAATTREAQRLWTAVSRPNVMIKIPGTGAGLGAIEHSIAAGINVNVTLLFSVERYREVIDAFLRGLERRAADGKDISHVHSVASFFVSRVDTKVDPLLDKAGDPHGVRGRTAIANAAMAYRLFEETLTSARWLALQSRGARPQRPLWASTSTKDPKYPDTWYVEALIAPRTVNTLPPETFDAYRDHGKPMIRIHEAQARAGKDLEGLAATGIDLAQVTHELEVEGVRKFAGSHDQLIAGIESKLELLAVGNR